MKLRNGDQMRRTCVWSSRSLRHHGTALAGWTEAARNAAKDPAPSGNTATKSKPQVCTRSMPARDCCGSA